MIDGEHWVELAYHPGMDVIAWVVKDGKVVTSAEWPTAAEWLAAGSRNVDDTATSVAVAGVPLAAGAVTPSRYDLTPAAVRERLAGLSVFLREYGVRLPPVRDLGDAIDPPLLDAPLTILVGGHNGVTFTALAQSADLAAWGLLTLDAHHDVRPYAPGAPGNGSPVRPSSMPGCEAATWFRSAFTASRTHPSTGHGAKSRASTFGVPRP